MKLLTSIVVAVTLALGSVGAVLAFRTAAESPDTSTPPSANGAPAARAKPVTEPVTGSRFKPCPPGTELTGQHCVRRVVHTVVVGGSSTTAASRRATAYHEPASAASGDRHHVGDDGPGKTRDRDEDDDDDGEGESASEHEDHPDEPADD